MADDFRLRVDGEQVACVDKEYFARYLAALDVQLTPEFLIAEGNLVAIHDMNRIKHTRQFQGRPPAARS